MHIVSNEMAKSIDVPYRTVRSAHLNISGNCSPYKCWGESRNENGACILKILRIISRFAVEHEIKGAGCTQVHAFMHSARGG